VASFSPSSLSIGHAASYDRHGYGLVQCSATVILWVSRLAIGMVALAVGMISSALDSKGFDRMAPAFRNDLAHR
jgi:hypothetical protein